MKRALAKSSPRPALLKNPEPVATLPELLRGIIEYTRIHSHQARLTTTGDHVLLDQEVDHYRCIIIAKAMREHTSHAMTLSPREQEIARMVARGYANKTIARILEISTWTVGTYLRRIFAKLNVGTRASMVARLRELQVYVTEEENTPLQSRS
jgi:DNA-binding CsgD family transcriptional regulator